METTTMPIQKLILAATLLFTSSFASAKLVGETDIQFPQPLGHEELCANSQEVYQHISKGTHAESLLVTCFINQEMWSSGEGAVMYKVEIMRPFINQKFSDSDFSGYIAGLRKQIGYVNTQVQSAGNAISKDEKKTVDELLLESGGATQYSARKGTWQHVQSERRFEVLQMVTNIKLQSNGRLLERDVATVMAFVNIKGKLLTLKVVNSKNEANPSQAAVSAMRHWIGRLIQANAL